MTLVEGLIAFLEATPAVVALAGERIYAAEAQQNEAGRRVVVTRLSERDTYTLAGGATGHPVARVQVDCHGGAKGPGYTRARELADAVLAADGGAGGRRLDGYYGGKWGGASGVKVQSCRAEDDADGDEPPRAGGGCGEQSARLVLVISYVKQ